MKRILSTLSQKWPEYLLEVLVLIIGIYGAFALEKWNEDRKERKLEHKYLKSLLIDLNRDLESLENLKKVRQISNESAWTLLNTESISASYAAQSEWSDHMINIGFWYEFVPNDNTFKELSNSGNLSLFQNDSVKIGLLNLEAFNDQIIAARDHMRREFDQYLYDEMVNYDEFALLDYQHMVEKGSMDIQYLPTLDDKTLSRLTREANETLKNQKIQNAWKLSILNSSYLIGLYDQMIIEINRTLRHINQSIDRR
jgi:hypothetical protein